MTYSANTVWLQVGNMLSNSWLNLHTFAVNVIQHKMCFIIIYYTIYFKQIFKCVKQLAALIKIIGLSQKMLKIFLLILCPVCYSNFWICFMVICFQRRMRVGTLKLFVHICMCWSSLFLEQAYLWGCNLQISAEKFDVYMLLFTELTKMKKHV